MLWSRYLIGNVNSVRRGLMSRRMGCRKTPTNLSTTASLDMIISKCVRPFCKRMQHHVPEAHIVFRPADQTALSIVVQEGLGLGFFMIDENFRVELV